MALLSVLAALLGAGLFEHAEDPWLTVVPFLLVVLATSALTRELTDQAQRGRGTPAGGWARSDTAIVVTLAVLAALLTASAAFARTSPGEHTAAACFAALYLVLAGYFWYVRRRNPAG
ncbi:hypothetical protein [Actinoplanes sp. URMC 104]|uniref:hypothetical protein n=1 Tax=Actinoplanes sp. URMC 104 TaxID=3423409 RepID=UPI003F1A733E